MPSMAANNLPRKNDTCNNNHSQSIEAAKGDFVTRRQRIQQQRKSLPIASGNYFFFLNFLLGC
ncbi:unnamed protein product [Coffea canephora]|uniref:Uncharacterized protein n=1 Tax=Coffea canephora TaxID=49390 RepID=A0A068TW01_COFCA|nr:unnamed protein product [Coffea canephora]